jgi:hypothetical protein
MRAGIIVQAAAWLLVAGVSRTAAQREIPPVSAPAALPAGSEVVDAVAARIEDDIITESEVRELGAFQRLVDGQAKPRADVIRELVDQWIVRGEADTAKYPQPTRKDVDQAYQGLLSQFKSPEEFKSRCARAGISEAAIGRLLAEQLYLSHFLDYRFRPAAQVDEKQVEAYYNDEFEPQLKAKNQPVPALDDVEDTIHEVLVQRAIDDLSKQWLDDTRGRLKIDIVSDGEQR